HVSTVRNEAHYQLMRQRRDEVLSGRIVQYITKTEFPNRGLCDLLTTLVPRWEPDGSIKSYFTFAQDITELMDIERALTEREQQLRLVMDSVPALISYRDRNLFYKYVNQPYADWYGCRREDMIGRHMTSITRLVEFRALKPYLDKVLAGERCRHVFEPDSIGVDKPTVSVDYVPHKDESGIVVGFFALAQEIVSPTAGDDAPVRAADAPSDGPSKPLYSGSDY
ncbi:MAG: PAS domain-containing protein, partial [Pseudomonadota bacterium]